MAYTHSRFKQLPIDQILSKLAWIYTLLKLTINKRKRGMKFNSLCIHVNPGQRLICILREDLELEETQSVVDSYCFG